MSQWIEVSVRVDGEGAEAVADALQRYVHQGVAIEQALPQEVWPEGPLPGGPMVVRAYFAQTAEAEHTKQQIREALAYLRMIVETIPEPTFSIVAEEDWADAWKKHYRPVRVGKRIVVCPAWLEPDAGPEDIVIRMDPGMAFGTGTHPTTQLCLRACEWFCRPATTMLDLGSGSGILAIAAARLGCMRVLAREIDPVAVEAAQANVERNGVSDVVTVQRGGLEGLVTSARHFDIGMANLTAKIILNLVPQGLQHVIWPGGRFVFSGIIDEQAADVIDALDGIGLALEGQRTLGDWVMLITRRRIP